jgi:lipid II:glycine glycyltransferase (peptidoglycan interpeptide bridge formation enzyme)
LDRSEDDVFAALHANQVRRNIRRAQRAGVVVRPGNAEADVTEVFYRLHTRTRHRLGVPVQPLRYFRLLWEAIRWAMARGCRTFDFGRTDLADNGLREFKARWGTVEREFSCSVLADAPARAGVGGVPSPLRSAIRRGPMFVPRVLGELLYRHTA